MEISLSVYEFVSLFLSTCALIIALIAYYEAGIVRPERRPEKEGSRGARREERGEREKTPFLEKIRKRFSFKLKEKKKDEKEEREPEKRKEEEKEIDMDEEIVRKIRDHEINPFDE